MVLVYDRHRTFGVHNQTESSNNLVHKVGFFLLVDWKDYRRCLGTYRCYSFFYPVSYLTQRHFITGDVIDAV